MLKYVTAKVIAKTKKMKKDVQKKIAENGTKSNVHSKPNA